MMELKSLGGVMDIELLSERALTVELMCSIIDNKFRDLTERFNNLVYGES